MSHLCQEKPDSTFKWENKRKRLPDDEPSGRVRISSRWRRARDSNPRELAPKRFSRPPRYDHFASPPYIHASHIASPTRLAKAILAQNGQIINTFFCFSYVSSWYCKSESRQCILGLRVRIQIVLKEDLKWRPS